MSGGFFAERIKKYEDVIKLQNEIIRRLNLSPSKEALWAALHPPVLELYRRYPSKEPKNYSFYYHGDHWRNDRDIQIDCRLRMLNRQACLLHLLGRSAEAAKYDRLADAQFNDLRLLRATKRSLDLADVENKYGDHQPEDWLPLE